jgi:hypothetical protein
VKVGIGGAVEADDSAAAALDDEVLDEEASSLSTFWASSAWAPPAKIVAVARAARTLSLRMKSCLRSSGHPVNDAAGVSG